jgi:hypothetical protein
MLLMSSLLYETEEGAMQNRLEQWWVLLSDTGPRAIGRHTAFVAGVASLGAHLFDRFFGNKLFSARSIGVSACFSLACLGIVCSPGLSGLLSEIPGAPYFLVVVLLLAMGFLPGALGPRLPQKSWLVGVAILVVVAFCGMDIVDWFNLPIPLALVFSEMKAEYIRYYFTSREFFYYFTFVFLTIASDTLFIAATRWLLRVSAKLRSNLTIIVLMLVNVALACLLVVFPVSEAWGLKSVAAIISSGHAVDAANHYASLSNTKQSFLATLAGSNLLDGLVACAFFLVLLVLLLHRLVWPIVQRPIYALATRDVMHRRKFFFALGLVLVGLGGVPRSVIDHVTVFLKEILGL